MFKTIVVGSDGRRGRGAAALGQLIAEAGDARLLLVGVELPLVESFRELRVELEADLRALHDALAPAAETQIAVDLSPARALRRVAHEEQADLVVVGSRQPGALRRLGGDSAMQVLHGAPCAVAVAPDGLPACERIETIGVGLDTTPEARAALGLALELAQRTGATIRLLAVASDVYPGSANLVVDMTYADRYAKVIDERVQTARRTVDEALETCAAVAATGDVRLGDPSGELVALSAGCDLLVLGSRRWGPVRRLVLGSTSEAVIRHAECAVLVLPREAASEYDETHVGDVATVAL
jgi:nucleotide-binding universal stress UspA family protein